MSRRWWRRIDSAPASSAAGHSPDAGSVDSPGDVRLSIWVDGLVQGVGFRWWVRQRALELSLRGSAVNLLDGRVAVVVQGPRPDCQRLLDALSGRCGPGAPGSVRSVDHRWDEPGPVQRGFVVS